MAAFCRLAVTVLEKNINCTISKGSLFTNFLQNHRAATQLDFPRYRRRERRTPPWIFSTKDKGIGFQNAELTPDNQSFLREIVEDKFKDSPLKETVAPRNPWTTKTFRTGVIGIKLGSYPLWFKDGKKANCILFQIIDNHVLKYEPPEEFVHARQHRPLWGLRYGAVTVGALSTNPYHYTEHYNKLFEEAGVPPKRKVSKFIVSPEAAVQPGTPLNAMHFKVGQYVDVRARTIGHGFQGVMKRHGFSGGPATHGSSKFHRRPGSISSGLNKRVIKGQRMPGRMGFKWRFKRGLQIIRINTKYNVIYTTGANCPGPNHCMTLICDSVLPNTRRQLAKKIEEDSSAGPPMPTYYPELDATSDIPEEINHPDLYDLSTPSIEYEVEEKKKA